ncbi:D-alanyl-lipoteichoic acid biosynthesis protein DltD [Clostridium weizhouense]|uniref:Protein DltD n=1 Tax=Clostridium weizhouense TaxID=2859781 RepID=A0ABS7AS02_9CLOT|nr:D-alanyl-lipoteichoic acid biosynthesis protein DltD [Clostridium weizhouense]MBW6411458.1 D-alanyl-lipoteichoic acid biosynthesis protein DltD [Clostridium weizhouense]
MKKIFSILIPIVFAIIFTIGIDKSLDNKIDMLCKTKDISLVGKVYGDAVKDKSAVIKDLLSAKGDLFLIGSSELGIDVEQNPINLFPIKGCGYDVSCFGRPYTQDLQQATYLGATNLQSNQKVAFISSIQWFEDKNAIGPSHFAVNFSDIQFYKFLKNPKISDENKQYYAGRISKLLTKAKKNPAEAFYAKLYYNPTPTKKVLKLIFEPYYKTKQYLLNIKDKALIYKKLKSLPDGAPKTGYTIDWKAEKSKAQDEINKTVSTNEFHISDKWYNKNLKKELDNLKLQSKDEDPVNSKEMDDYKFFLSVCKELDIKPYVILMPVNGWFYDYTGLTKDKRYQFYDKVKELAEGYNLEVLDLREHEYEKGFLIDPKHLGKTGWLKVSENIFNYFNKKQ